MQFVAQPNPAHSRLLVSQSFHRIHQSRVPCWHIGCKRSATDTIATAPPRNQENQQMKKLLPTSSAS
jgi:hypothetical protein